MGLQATAIEANPFGGFDGPPVHVPAPAPVPQPARPTVVAAPAPAATPGNPWATLEPQGAAPQLQPMPAPAYPAPAAYPQPYSAPAAPAPAYPQPAPVAAYPAPAPQPAPQPQQVEEVSETPQKPQARSTRLKPGAAPAAAGGIPKQVVYGLAGYAVLMTILALYGLLMKSSEVPPEHPLSTIPDSFGEFDPAQRKKLSLYRFKVDGPLPANQVAQLGGKIEVGGLEIEPLKIDKRALEIFTGDSKGQKAPTSAPGSALVLRLKIRNNSDMPFCPLDPAFSRKGTRDDIPANRIVVGTNPPFAGGPLLWPTTKAGTRQFEREQEKDSEPLKPGETREYSVCSTTKPELITAIRKASDQILWRVQVRRAPVEFHGKSIPVTAIIGVEFAKSDVPNL